MASTTSSELEDREARRILLEVADALADAHGEGVLHRDLRPENILLERAGALDDDVPPRVRPIDFGVAAFPARERQVATALAVGATRVLLVRQMFVETAILSLGAGALAHRLT